MLIQAPATWRCVDFISDLHLQACDEASFAAWADYMADSPADALFILGDLFEVWIGDDVLADPVCFESRCTRILHDYGSRRDLYIMHGNRDFLMGPALMHACRAHLLPDPTILEFAGHRLALTHGDAQCTDDSAYMGFRANVRSVQWQTHFLSLPLLERLAQARALRDQSEAKKLSGYVYADLNPEAIEALLRQTQANGIVHGHTHRPSDHTLPNGIVRRVLSDWDATTPVPRAEALRLTYHPIQDGDGGTKATFERITLINTTH
jgi:UDP-2,3-diacylglucosamine hydrolase